MATSFPRGIQFCVGEDLAYRIVDLTFHGQWHIARVRCQPPCSSRFACLGNYRSHVVLPLIKLHKQGGGDTCRLGVVALPLRGCSFRLERRLVAVTIMSP